MRKDFQYRTKLLSKIRESRWTVEDLAWFTKIPEVSIARIIRGEERPGMGALRHLSVVLNCQVEDLLEDEDGEI